MKFSAKVTRPHRTGFSTPSSAHQPPHAAPIAALIQVFTSKYFCTSSTVLRAASRRCGRQCNAWASLPLKVAASSRMKIATKSTMPKDETAAGTSATALATEFSLSLPGSKRITIGEKRASLFAASQFATSCLNAASVRSRRGRDSVRSLAATAASAPNPTIAARTNKIVNVTATAVGKRARRIQWTIGAVEAAIQAATSSGTSMGSAHLSPAATITSAANTIIARVPAPSTAQLLAIVVPRPRVRAVAKRLTKTRLIRGSRNAESPHRGAVPQVASSSDYAGRRWSEADRVTI